MKARYDGSVLKPLDKLDLIDGEEVDIGLKKRSLFGLLKKWKIDPQYLKDDSERPMINYYLISLMKILEKAFPLKCRSPLEYRQEPS